MGEFSEEKLAELINALRQLLKRDSGAKISASGATVPPQIDQKASLEANSMVSTMKS
jgi:hypothetical protein